MNGCLHVVYDYNIYIYTLVTEKSQNSPTVAIIGGVVGAGLVMSLVIVLVVVIVAVHITKKRTLTKPTKIKPDVDHYSRDPLDDNVIISNIYDEVHVYTTQVCTDHNPAYGIHTQ